MGFRCPGDPYVRGFNTYVIQKLALISYCLFYRTVCFCNFFVRWLEGPGPLILETFLRLREEYGRTCFRLLSFAKFGEPSLKPFPLWVSRPGLTGHFSGTKFGCLNGIVVSGSFKKVRDVATDSSTS